MYSRSPFYTYSCTSLFVFRHLLCHSASRNTTRLTPDLCRTSRRLLPTHKVLLWMADVMFLLTSAHMVLLLYETFTATVPPRVLQAAVAIAQFQVGLGFTNEQTLPF